MNAKFKLLISTALTTILLSSSLSFANLINVYVNDSKLNMSTQAVIEQERTLVPLRSIFESMGATVRWEQSTKTVTGFKGDKSMQLQIGNKSATVNNRIVKLDVAAVLRNDYTLVPARFIAESLGSEVDWDNNTRSVLIDSKYPYGQYKVNRVVDGDTLKINFNGKEESLRLIGVDTPESVHSDSSKNTAEGKIASDYTKSILEGKNVAVEFDVQERDQYGRLLGYVWVNGKMFNKTLVQEGYAKIATYPPNVRYVEDFTQQQTQARNNKKGFWKHGEFGQAAPVKPTPQPQPKPPAPKPQPNPVVKPNPPVQPTTGNLVITMTGTKYHRPTCRTVKQVKQKVTAQQAQKMGYTACKVCKP